MIFPPHPTCRLLAGLLALCWAGAAGAALQIEADAELLPLLQTHLEYDADEIARGGEWREAQQHSLLRQARDLLATAGYFSPQLSSEDQGTELLLKVDSGPRSRVSAVDIRVEGKLSPDELEQIRASWLLPVGAAFTQNDWDRAKTALLARLGSEAFPDASLASSDAEVDPASASVQLSLLLRSQARVLFGAIHYSGLQRYSENLAARYAIGVKQGDPFSTDAMLELQQSLQRTPYFSTVQLELQPPAADSPEPQVRDVLVRLTEREAHALSSSVGYSSNTGARVGLAFDTADLFGRGWEMHTGADIEQRRQAAFVDVFMPRTRFGANYGVGGGMERSDIENLYTESTAFGLIRTHSRGALEMRDTLNWQAETQSSPDRDTQDNRAITLNRMWSWRHLDSATAPRRGVALMGQLGGGIRPTRPDEGFFRLHGRGHYYLPVGSVDTLALRTELGATLTHETEGIPSDWLFRTGGSQSVRGYRYQSLGIQEGSTVYGARYLAVASVEYTHWFGPSWGAASFIDLGDARDALGDFRLARGIGFGPRWRSPVGPLALDLAWGEREHEWRAHFSLAIPF
ncbi:autotransporter assembly complex family protein [Uliginosibacterium sp. 31-12]|uniref:autotransporter assembly complex protein TamA n=1 Tax=Uliginosibacterium sp. 31-12 TaxID=3062781 RepID=UPI0026E2023F|nr:BamA/TamA family outer membrane protein [Uliginosibacterium sp. 31-12]MDO6388210.1 BamA/TamA family outer membrane protein [Uliginosibacterium sp. 31-12]